MDWQQAVSLLIVATTAGLFLWARFRRRKFSLERDTHCGCASPGGAASKGSIVFRARKCTFLVMEINYGAFESIIEVPAGYDLGQAKASYQNGFLRVDVPELAQPSSKTISVSNHSGKV